MCIVQFYLAPYPPKHSLKASPESFLVVAIFVVVLLALIAVCTQIFFLSEIAGVKGELAWLSTKLERVINEVKAEEINTQ